MIVIIGGGTATNALAPMLSRVSSRLCYILPISDNGGSTSELIRVIGGPAIGDLRSRITRLIQAYNTVDGAWTSTLAQGVYNLFLFRLSLRPDQARAEWNAIVDGTHGLWAGLEAHVKEIFRAFLIHVNLELMKRFSSGHGFRFEHASVGNLCLSGARLYFGNPDSAVELVLRMALIPRTVQVLPAINTNHIHHISAQLEDGRLITGQSQISHPSIASPMQTPHSAFTDIEDAQLPFSHPELTRSQLHISKLHAEPLTSPIERIFYINPYGHEIHPRASARVLQTLAKSRSLVYSIGSLYTSIVPILLLQGVAEAIEKMDRKVFVLNGSADRETTNMSATDHVEAAVRALAYSRWKDADAPVQWSDYVTHLVAIRGGEIGVDCEERRELESMGIAVVEVEGATSSIYDGSVLERVLVDLLT